jgi:hypothetical protein
VCVCVCVCECMHMYVCVRFFSLFHGLVEVPTCAPVGKKTGSALVNQNNVHGQTDGAKHGPAFREVLPAS